MSTKAELEEQIESLQGEIGECEEEIVRLQNQIISESESLPSLREAITDRHERHCGPKYGQGIESCPDVVCRDAYKSLEDLS